MFVEVLCMASAVRFKKTHERFYCSVRCLPSFLLRVTKWSRMWFGMVWEKAEGPPRVFQDSSLIRQASYWFLEGRLGRNDCLVSSPLGHPSWQEGSYRFRWGLENKWSNSHILGIWYWYVIVALSDSQPSPKTWSFQEHRQQEAASHFTQISSSREITGAHNKSNSTNRQWELKAGSEPKCLEPTAGGLLWPPAVSSDDLQQKTCHCWLACFNAHLFRLNRTLSTPAREVW